MKQNVAFYIKMTLTTKYKPILKRYYLKNRNTENSKISVIYLRCIGCNIYIYD